MTAGKLDRVKREPAVAELEVIIDEARFGTVKFLISFGNFVAEAGTA